MASDQEKALQAKNDGNAAFSRGDHAAAISFFTEAINLDPKNHILFSNRSAAYASVEKYEEALSDADETIRLKHDWAKGYARKGAALHFLGRYEEASVAYKKGLDLEPENKMLIDGLREAEQVLRQERHSFSPASFLQGDIMGKLRNNPITAPYLNQPDFVSLVENMQRDPSLLEKNLHDERVVQMMGVLLGIPIHPAAPPTKESEKEKKKEKEPEPMELEILEEKKLAEKEKELGNSCYKDQKFEEAIAHYTTAIGLYKDEVSYLSNRAAAYLENKQYDECIADCELALEECKRLRQYNLLARIYLRMGNCFAKQLKWEEAIKCYNKSLTENRSADTLKRLQQAEKAKKEADELAYFSPEISTEERAKGNEFFKNHQYPEVFKGYDDAIKRNPNDHLNYSNRAAAYSKLGEFPSALKDAETCVGLEPTFVKGWSRKGLCHHQMKEYHKALAAYDEGLKHDPQNQECRSGIMMVERTVAASQGSAAPDEEQIRHAMADPEIRAIISDPVMQTVLQDFQTNPQAAQQHLKNPGIMDKLQKLVHAGIIRLG